MKILKNNAVQLTGDEWIFAILCVLDAFLCTYMAHNQVIHNHLSILCNSLKNTKKYLKKLDVQFTSLLPRHVRMQIYKSRPFFIPEKSHLQKMTFYISGKIGLPKIKVEN